MGQRSKEDRGLILAVAFYREPDGSVYEAMLLQDLVNGSTYNYVSFPDIPPPVVCAWPDHSFLSTKERRGKHIELQQLLWDSTVSPLFRYGTHCSAWSRAVREADDEG